MPARGNDASFAGAIFAVAQVFAADGDMIAVDTAAVVDVSAFNRR
ncbi:hypothetical protein l11_22360 [Neisseria weaveri LMG 5135]|nr:hypothetical protein l11_22360 [Neisseria weaveri LMG 5135]